MSFSKYLVFLDFQSQISEAAGEFFKLDPFAGPEKILQTPTVTK